MRSKKVAPRTKKMKGLDELKGLARDISVALLVVALIFAGLFAYTNVWPPFVVIESQSMTHPDNGYGKVGTIDAGDFVLVKKAYTRDDVTTYFAGKKTGYSTYNSYGDVIIYDKNGAGDTPVIHRAMCWVDVIERGEAIWFNVTELDMYYVSPEDGITIPQLNLRNYKPPHSGFITKGDANNRCDQDPSTNIRDKNGLSVTPVMVEWILGKGVGEIPWFGLLKLTADDWTHGTNNARHGTEDCWTMLGISLFILITVPITIDVSYPYLKKKGVGQRIGRSLRAKMRGLAKKLALLKPGFGKAGTRKRKKKRVRST